MKPPTRIRPYSKTKRARLKSEIKVIFSQIIRELCGHKCIICGTHYATQTCHQLSVGSHPHLFDEVLNALLCCDTHHAHLDYRGNAEQHSAAWAQIKIKAPRHYAYYQENVNAPIVRRSDVELRERRDSLKLALDSLKVGDV